MSKQLTEFDLQRIQTLHNEQEAARVALAEEIGCSIDMLRCVIRQLDGDTFRPIALVKRKSSWSASVSEYAANKRHRQLETVSEKSAPGQLFKEAAIEYRALNKEQKAAIKKRDGTWIKAASFSEAQRAWNKLLDGFDDLTRQTRDVFGAECVVLFTTCTYKYEKLKTLKKKARATIPWQEIQNSLERGNGFVPTPWKVEWNSKFAAPKDMKASARNALLRAIHKNTFDFIWKEQVDETAQVQIDTVHESDSEEEQEVEQ
ncbi:hypothetical protein BJV82DRAFT_662562 [Fennellomyces sp. T-0311]|nr:hypothetical protein BJV82DRAFT_662562 [Fennellomyces sp. T-0311]